MVQRADSAGSGFARKLLIGLLCAAIAVIAFLQNVSVVFADRSPQLALSTWPGNGVAMAHKAILEMSVAVAEETPITNAAEAQRNLAIAAFRSDPLSPKALAILILSQPEDAGRSQMIDSAIMLNRRDLTLQGLALESSLEAGNIPAVVRGIDHILRVHESSRAELFPILRRFLGDTRSLPVLAEFLSTPSQWRLDFLRTAATDPNLTTNLLALRRMTGIRDREFDRRLVAHLAQQRRYAEGYEIFANYPSSARMGDAVQVLRWDDPLPPYGWSLTNQSNFRAMVSADGKTLDILVGSGQGGSIASRVFPVQSQFTLAIPVSEMPDAAEGAFSMTLTCARTDQVIATRNLREGSNSISAETSGSDCRFVKLSLDTRVSILEPTFNVTIGDVVLR